MIEAAVDCGAIDYRHYNETARYNDDYAYKVHNDNEINDR